MLENTNFNFATADYDSQLAHKRKVVEQMLAPFTATQINVNELEVFASPPANFRMRAEFRVWHAGPDTYHIMFDQDTKQQYRVDQLPSASELINKAMEIVQAALLGNEVLRKKLFQIDYLSTLSGELLISMLYHRALEDDWDAEVAKLAQQFAGIAKVDFIGRSRKQKRLVNRDYVRETLNINGSDYHFKQIENSFTQPNAIVNQSMIEWAIAHTKDLAGDLLELYCGAGNFSVPMAKVFDKVLATEISKTSVAAAQFNINDNHIDNLSILRLSSEEFVQAMNKEREFSRLKDINLEDYHFSTVLVDPPRAGIDPGTIALISRFEYIVYISCNPNTLVDNLQDLCKSHEIVNSAIFDQFPFTAHIESGVILKRKSTS